MFAAASVILIPCLAILVLWYLTRGRPDPGEPQCTPSRKPITHTPQVVVAPKPTRIIAFRWRELEEHIESLKDS
jgi:hypothetical protein